MVKRERVRHTSEREVGMLDISAYAAKWDFHSRKYQDVSIETFLLGPEYEFLLYDAKLGGGGGGDCCGGGDEE